MALAVHRTGVIFKKCDISNHRPETVKQCVSGTCQHTCLPDTVEKCKHAWTLRSWVNGKQLEKSFKDELRNRRVVYGSGRKLAQDFQLKLTVDKRSAAQPQGWDSRSAQTRDFKRWGEAGVSSNHRQRRFCRLRGLERQQVGWLGCADVVPLAEVAPLLTEHSPRGAVFDAFGYDLQPEVVGKVDDGLDDSPRVPRCRHVGNERAIDLDR